MATTDTQNRRSSLSKEEARQRYIRLGEMVALEQIERDSRALDDGPLAIGPFSRLDANQVAARVGKTRGAISNLFGSQANFQAETMAATVNASDLILEISYPDPGDHPDADAWLDALLTGEAERGPVRGGKPTTNYGSLWALWLSTVPYGLWSEEISRPSMEEYGEWLNLLEQGIREALDHFGLRLRADTNAADLACALASLIEGVWINQCLTTRHPADPAQPLTTVLLRSGMLLWRGATEMVR